MNHSLAWSTPYQNRSLFRETLLVLAGIVLLALSAQCVIPLQPVPLTFQSAFVVLLGMTYGSRLGVITVLSYLLVGTLGLPVFESLSGGAHVLIGATSGYLFGFIPAVFLGGFLTERGFAKNIFTAFIAAMLSASVIFFFGLFVLTKMIGLHQAIAFGLLPFVMTEPLKLFAVALIIPNLWKKTSK